MRVPFSNKKMKKSQKNYKSIERKQQIMKQNRSHAITDSQYSSVRIHKIVYQSSLYQTQRQYHKLFLIKHILMSIIVRPIQATLTRDVELIAKMDPFVKVYLGGQCQQTSVCNNGGKNPNWNTNLTFNNTGDNNLRVQVWDHDTIGSNDVIGVGNLNLTSVMQQGGGNSIWVDLFYKGQSAGRVCLAIQMENPMGMKPGMGMGQGVGQVGGFGQQQPMGQQFGQHHQYQ